jgi:hypothetical protein
MPRARHALATRPRSVPGADGMAMITSSGSVSSRIRGNSSPVVPSTRTPSTRMRRFVGSSSTKPTGLSRRPGLRSTSRSTSRPPSPAPTISTLRASRRARNPRGRSCARRATRRAPSRNESVSSRKSATTLGGRLTGTMPSLVSRVTGWVIDTSVTSPIVDSTTAWTTAIRSRWPE